MMAEDREERKKPRLREPVALPTVGSAGGGGAKVSSFPWWAEDKEGGTGPGGLECQDEKGSA